MDTKNRWVRVRGSWRVLVSGPRPQLGSTVPVLRRRDGEVVEVAVGWVDEAPGGWYVAPSGPSEHPWRRRGRAGHVPVVGEKAYPAASEDVNRERRRRLTAPTKGPWDWDIEVDS